MTDCKLLHTCPFFNDNSQEASKPDINYKEEYCHGSYAWCGRYIISTKLETEKKLMENGLITVPGTKDNHRGQLLTRPVKHTV